MRKKQNSVEKCRFLLSIDKLAVNALNILSHACNSVIMFLDILIVAYPLRLYHVIQPLAFVSCYGIFSYIYYLFDGKSLYVNYLLTDFHVSIHVN